MKTNVALIGAGFISEYHLDILSKMDHINLVAICDLKRESAERIAKLHNLNAYRKSEDLIKSEKIDVAHILVPPPYHFSTSKLFVENGINVLVEKPFVLSSTEGKELIQIAEETNVKIGCNHNQIFHPLFLRLLDDIKHYRIGRIEHVISFNNNPLRQLVTGDFGHWMFASPENIIFEQGPHPLSQIYTLLGKVLNVRAIASNKMELSINRDFYKNWRFVLECERGDAILYFSFGANFPENWIHIVGQDGAIFVDLLNNTYTRQGKSKYPDFFQSFQNGISNACRLGIQSVKNVVNYSFSLLRLRGRTDVFYLSMKNSIHSFYQAFCTNQPLPTSAADALAVIEAIETAMEVVSMRGEYEKTEIQRDRETKRRKDKEMRRQGDIECEKILVDFWRNQNLPVVIFRPGIVVGQKGTPMHSSLGMWVHDIHCMGWGRGNTPLPFVLVEDVVTAMLNALTIPNIEGQSFNLAGDVRLYAREYVELLRKYLGRDFRFHPQHLCKIQCIEVFKWFVKNIAGKRENPFPSYWDLKTRSLQTTLDCTKAKTILSWHPTDDFEDFVAKAIKVHIPIEEINGIT